MSKTTTIVNHLNSDRIMIITLFNHKYLIFTLMYRNIIVLDITDKDDVILLMNSECSSKNDVIKGLDLIAMKALNATSNDDFECELGTYIHLNDVGNNDTTAEISNVYKIIAEDYNL